MDISFISICRKHSAISTRPVGAVSGSAALTALTAGAGDVVLGGIIGIGAAATEVGLGGVGLSTALDATATAIGVAGQPSTVLRR
jgi:hypothetical protein